MNEGMITVERMSRDIRAAASTLSNQEARYLVDSYYQSQEDRIRADGRVRAMADTAEPHSVIAWLSDQSSTLENQIKSALDKYSMSHPVGEWMRGVKGIGPVIAAGYLANLDISRAPTVGHFWAACGVVPGKDRRVKGERSNWNPALKRLLFLTGESFKRLSSDDPDAFYRKVYDERKAYEQAKNEAGAYADQAAHALTVKRFGDETVAKTFYAAGKLPPGHIDRRACRYSAKLFIAALHEVWWKHEYGTDPAKPYPLPYAIAHLGHAHVIPPPH